MLRYPKKSHRHPFTIPERSPELAEFCGIMLGDGGISRYQAKITLHAAEELGYGSFVSSLTQKLFGIRPGIQYRTHANAFDLVLSRVGICDFLVCECGLVRGDKIKQCIDIPSWIMDVTELRIACVRGLIDTDGCIFTHRYMSKGKNYEYRKLAFTSLSVPLLNSVGICLADLGIKPRFAGAKDVRIDSRAGMECYFSSIGSHNPKHLRRYYS